ncbi:MAG: hypothetical protein NVSMB4_03740 [Acidimicrobiales bacterium]
MMGTRSKATTGRIAVIAAAATAVLLVAGAGVAVLQPAPSSRQRPTQASPTQASPTQAGSSQATSAIAIAPAGPGASAPQPGRVSGSDAAVPGQTGVAGHAGAGGQIAPSGAAGQSAPSGAPSGIGAPAPPTPPASPVAEDTIARSGEVDVEVPKGRFADAFSAAADVARQFGGFVVITQVSSGTPPIAIREDAASGVRSGGPAPAIAPAPGIGPYPGPPSPYPGPPVSWPPVSYPVPPEPGSVPSGTLVVRVPGSRFDDARRSFERLGHLRSEQLSGQDAGGQIVDSGARLADLHASQDALRAMAAKATSTTELLQIQSQLSNVSSQIAGLTAQLDRLHNAVALASITVRVSEPLPPVAAPRDRTVLDVRMAQAGRAVESVVGGTIVVLAYAAPLALLALLVAGLVTLVARRRRASMI